MYLDLAETLLLCFVVVVFVFCCCFVAVVVAAAVVAAVVGLVLRYKASALVLQDGGSCSIATNQRTKALERRHTCTTTKT